jgi:hypothetical protein
MMVAAARAAMARVMLVVMSPSAILWGAGSLPLVRSCAGVCGTDVQELGVEAPSGEEPSYSDEASPDQVKN